MKRWTEKTALQALKGSDVEFNKNVITIGSKGLSGLSACSAYDYLKKYCNYI